MGYFGVFREKLLIGSSLLQPALQLHSVTGCHAPLLRLQDTERFRLGAACFNLRAFEVAHLWYQSEKGESQNIIAVKCTKNATK